MSVIFATSPTSGTASMQRVIQAIAPEYKVDRLDAQASSTPEAGKAFIDPLAERTIYWFQGPRFWSPDLPLERHAVIAHFRDPRDMACNQYWWALQHPNERDTPEIAEAKRKKVESDGIDIYVTRKNNSASFNMIRDISESEIGEFATYSSYAQLCCAFDYLVDNLCKLFEKRPSSVVRALEIERPENLGGNKNWVKVGGTWQGSDVSPGRFRHDLSAEAAERVTMKYQSELAMMKRREAEFLRYHYE